MARGSETARGVAKTVSASACHDDRTRHRVSNPRLSGFVVDHIAARCPSTPFRRRGEFVSSALESGNDPPRMETHAAIVQSPLALPTRHPQGSVRATDTEQCDPRNAG